MAHRFFIFHLIRQGDRAVKGSISNSPLDSHNIKINPKAPRFTGGFAAFLMKCQANLMSKG
jgi:hypothetical protein